MKHITNYKIYEARYVGVSPTKEYRIAAQILNVLVCDVIQQKQVIQQQLDKFPLQFKRLGIELEYPSVSIVNFNEFKKQFNQFLKQLKSKDVAFLELVFNIKKNVVALSKSVKEISAGVRSQTDRILRQTEFYTSMYLVHSRYYSELAYELYQDSFKSTDYRKLSPNKLISTMGNIMLQRLLQPLYYSIIQEKYYSGVEDKLKRDINKIKKNVNKILVHEHVVPVDIISKKFFKLIDSRTNCDELLLQDIEKLFVKYDRHATVTIFEDNLLNQKHRSGIPDINIWYSRYSANNIKLYDMLKKEWVF